jgi:hypothetical protein
MHFYSFLSNLTFKKKHIKNVKLLKNKPGLGSKKVKKKTRI